RRLNVLARQPVQGFDDQERTPRHTALLDQLQERRQGVAVRVLPVSATEGGNTLVLQADGRVEIDAVASQPIVAEVVLPAQGVAVFLGRMGKTGVAEGDC